MNLRSFRESLLRSRFLRFGLVGAGGYVVDASVLAAMIYGLGLDPYSGRVISFLAAATFTWWGNRTITFAEHRAHGVSGMAGEWARFIAANAVGGAVNLGLYASVVRFAPAPLDNPFLAQPIGILAGLAFNFTLSKRLVFRGVPPP